MASAFKRDGIWYASFKGADGLWHSKASGTDKTAALQLASALQQSGQWRREGLVDPKADGFADAEGRKLAEHIEDYRRDLVARGASEKHVRLTVQRVKTVLAKPEHISGIKAAAVTEAVKALRDEGFSESSCGHYLRAAKLFSRWLVREGRAREDALTVLRVKVIQKSDRKRQRRALSGDEFARLVNTAQGGGIIEGMTGVDRAMLYRLAGGTGFRASELASLTPACFDLAADEPAIVVRAACSKRRRDDRQPIGADLATALVPWLKGKADSTPVFRLPRLNKLAAVVRADLRTAKARWIKETRNAKQRRKRQTDSFLAELDASGALVDLHTFRVSYISWLVESGATVKTCQELARHSTPVLTIGTYARMSLHDQGKALAGLPGALPTSPEQQAMKATGTDDASIISTELHTQRAQKTGGIFGHRLAQHGRAVLGSIGKGNQQKSPENKQFPANSQGNSFTGRSGIRTHESRICNPLH